MSLTARIRVAFQGASGNYSDELIDRVWNGRAMSHPCRGFRDAVSAVEMGAAEFAVLPIRNVLVGDIAESRVALAEADRIQVVRDIIFPIRHCFLARRGTNLGSLRSVLSHPVALAQCTHFFAANPALIPTPVFDTSGAAQLVAAKARPTLAAIAGRKAAERYKLAVLRENIADTPDNWTEFRIITTRGAPDPAPLLTVGNHNDE